jgi:glutamine amidotransferase-like uncharacterized protein
MVNQNSFWFQSARLLRALFSLVFFALSLAACQQQTGGPDAISLVPTPDGAPSFSDRPGGPEVPAPTPSVPAPPEPGRTWSVDALLFAGSGTWAAEVSSLKSILAANGASYLEVNSAELNSMTLDDLSDFGVLIFPGGSGGTQAGSLTSATRARLRQAVQERGVGYTGFCAGAFIAVAPAPSRGGDVIYGLGVVDGPVLDYYYLENQGVTAQMTRYQFADGSSRDVLWYGGPVTPDRAGDVIARYPNGDAAISQLDSGEGLVVISGGHPGVPASAKSALGLSDLDGNDYEATWGMISAAMNHIRLISE